MDKKNFENCCVMSDNAYLVKYIVVFRLYVALNKNSGVGGDQIAYLWNVVVMTLPLIRLYAITINLTRASINLMTPL